MADECTGDVSLGEFLQGILRITSVIQVWKFRPDLYVGFLQAGGSVQMRLHDVGFLAMDGADG